jgi:diguanylate cyclase (GGDEF)-like protein/PAS domain S-box-containing protein
MLQKLAQLLSRVSTAYVVLAVSIVLSAAAAYLAANVVERETELKFEGLISDSAEVIESRIRAYSDVLLGIRGMYIATKSVSRTEFRSYVNSLDLSRRYPGIQVIHYGHRISAEKRQAFEAAVRSDASIEPGGYPNFAIKPPGERPDYVVVQYVEPMAGNEGALGLDLGGDPVRLAVLERIRDSGQLTASGIIALALDPKRHPGFAMRVPLYQQGAPLATVAQRRAAFTGVVSASFVVLDLMRGVFGEQYLQKIHVRIHDAGFLNAGLQPPSKENLLFDSDRLIKPQSSQQISEGILSKLTSTASLDVGGRRWDLYFSAREGLITPSERWMPFVVFLGGSVISLLLFGFTRSLATSGSKAIELADRMTEDLRKSEAGLAEAQRMTQQLIESLPNPIFFKDTNGRYLGVNKAWETYFGTARDAFIGKTVHDLYPDSPEVADRLHAMDQALWAQPGTQTYETSITTPDGQRHDTIYYKATFTRADGNIAGLIGTIIDITERKELERRFRETFDQAAVGIVHTSFDGKYLQVNQKFCEMLGYSKSELMGRAAADFTHVEDRNKSQLSRQLMWEGKLSTFTEERRYLRQDGSILWANRTVSLARDASGKPMYFIRVIEDIGERKEIEELYRTTFDNAPVGIMHTAVDGYQILRVNRKLSEMLGYTHEELLKMTSTDLLHPDHRFTDRSKYNERLLSDELQSFTSERELIRKDGSPLWVNRTVSLVKNAAGEPLYFLRIIEDISERKRAEEMVAHERTLLRAIIDTLPDYIYVKDTSGLFQLCNEAWLKARGRTSEEIVGKPVSDFFPREIADSMAAQDQAIIESGVPQFNIEQKVPTTNPTGQQGAVRWSMTTKVPMRDASGNIIGTVGISRDISEQKISARTRAMEHEVTKILAESATVDEAMPNVIRAMCEAMDWAYGARWAWSKEERRLCRVEYWCKFEPQFDPADREYWLKTPDDGAGLFLRRVWQNKEPTWLDDLHEYKSFRRLPSAVKFGWRSAYCFPIIAGTEVVGIMEFFGPEARQPDGMLLQITSSIGSQIGQFMARKEAEERVRHLAHYDELTGLPNRSMFNEQLARALTLARRHNKPLAVLFIDLDRFKIINDTLGHDAGDRVLQEVAERLRGSLRDSDTVGRLGGDEFVVLIEELPDPIHVASVAQKILAAVAAPYVIESQEFHVTASIGISTYPEDSEDLPTLLKNADISMYRAKEQGKNNYQFYSSQMNVHSLEHLTLESSLRRALERDEFLLHYQPKIDIDSGRITGLEALIRWQQPGKSLIPPGQFIPLAEETGLIVPIGEWVLRTACARYKLWQAQGLPPLRIAVNLSPRQFAHANLLQDVARILNQTGMDPTCLEFEITESMVMHKPEQAVKLLNELKRMGIHLSIDDFGTGYSSLNYLKRFPIDSVKIDRSFISDIPGDADDAAITRAIISMAHSLRLKVIAEGVETAEQLSFLREHGCDEMQGYYYSAPLPEEQMVALLHRTQTSNAYVQ